MELDKKHSDDIRWENLIMRKAAGGDSFYYGVRTTGIFCRCGCASRLPNRENVEFFDTSKDAENAGYRPCKRCCPGAPSGHDKREQIVIQACRKIEQAEAPLKLHELAAETGMSPGHFHRLFKKIVGITPKQYAAKEQSTRLQKSLKTGQSVTEAIYDAGYSSTSRAYEKSQDRLAMTLGVYKRGGRGLAIHYCIAECSLGLLLVAVTDRGVCAIEFGDDNDSLSGQLQESFPRAKISRACSLLSSVIQDVISLVEAPDKQCTLPLDIQGSAFQQRVWSALRGIRPGTTASYSEIADRIGQPAAVRAVASACAANILAVAVPCHRVVRSDGKISGYKWGVERKRLLLQREKENVNTSGSK
ncbi:MAG: bifunctional DNA-binding transcriptional regulator/O6-methylguanine-DNA methyltransferase Ada [Desulforhopalus sp.]